MTKSQYGEHTRLENLVVEDLSKRGWENITVGTEYFKKKKRSGNQGGITLGEIDVYANRGNYYLDVECKCNYSINNYKHARVQLYRAEHNFFPKESRVFKVMAHFDKSHTSIIYKWVRR